MKAAVVLTGLTLFGQEGAETLGGASGWVGAGLLGAVLAWLLGKHLPKLLEDNDRRLTEKDRQLKDLISEKDAQMANTTAMFLAELKASREARHEERNQAHEAQLKFTLALHKNTVETNALTQEMRALAGSVGNLVEKVQGGGP